MKAPSFCKLRKEHSTSVRAFWSEIGHCAHYCLLINKEAQANIYGLSQGAIQTNFAKNICASPFNKELSKYTTLRHSHLDKFKCKFPI
jgi:hypothetical protein